MNIENIKVLTAQLKAIGFDNMGYAILKHICLAPVNFSITETFANVPERVLFTFYFEKDKKAESYRLDCYDAVLQKEASFDNLNIEGMNVKDINESMTQIDWKEAFDFSKRKTFNPDDKAGYENELKISQTIACLNRVANVEEGKSIAIALKQKHWSGIPYLDIMGTMANGRNKSEISQRFYFSEGQPAISADEAYRFLLNRWMEKQLQAKRKQQDNNEEAVTEISDTSSGSGLLKKRRTGINKRNKSTLV
ncbi:MAG: hypothetical protein QM725_07125 [Lacibacter sp.]|jgi:hypothetical protein|nr:hypothetical protein [Ferruginibacter sp.]HMP20269.1 hypothetical protein [Ferruginibacter sp.]